MAEKHECLDADWRRNASIVSIDGELLSVDLDSGRWVPATLRRVEYTNGALWVRDDRDEPIAFSSRHAPASYCASRIAHVVNDAELRIFDGDRDEPIAWFPGQQHTIRYLTGRFNDVSWSQDGRLIAAVLLHLVRHNEMTEEGRSFLEANPEIAKGPPEMLEQHYFEVADHALVLVDLEARQIAATRVPGTNFTFAPAP